MKNTTTSTQPQLPYSEDDPCDEWKDIDKLHGQDRDSPVSPVQRDNVRPKQPDI